MKYLQLFFAVIILFSAFTQSAIGANKQPVAQYDYAIRQGDLNYYSIKYDNMLVGYSAYKNERKMTLAGEQFAKLQSIAVLRLGIGGIEESVFKTDFSFSTKTLLPSYFTLQQQIGPTQTMSELVFTKGIIAQTNLSGKERDASVHETPNDCFLLFSNLWGKLDSLVEHYNILVTVAGNNKETDLNVYDPILKTEGKIKLTLDGNEYIKHNNQNLAANIYTLYDFYNMPLLKIWYDTKNYRIIKMNEIGGKITFELSTQAVENALKKSPGADLWHSKTALSPIYLQDKSKLNMMSLTASLQGRGLSSAPHEVIGFTQSFTGESAPSSMSGTFVTKKTPIKIENSGKFPPQLKDENIKQYLNNEAGIESNNDYIKNKAQEITWKSRDTLTAARKIAKWITENMKMGVSMPSALTAFNSGIVNPESRALLMTALCRAAGIPARMAGGLVFEKGSFIPGYWTEVYIENNGWLPFDLVSGEEGLDAGRVYLWEFGELTGVKIENMDFLPKPPKNTSFHQKDISWPVGEERIFEIKRNGEIIGQEKAIMTDFGIYEGQEVYTLKSDALLKVGKSLFKAEATTRLTPYALPVSFSSKSGIGDVVREENFKFTDNFIENIISETSNNDAIIQNIPYSKGAYILDQRYISLWALAVGQIPRIELDKKYTLTAFIPEEIKTMEIEIQVNNFEKIEAAGEELNVFKCETKRGLIFYVDQSGRVVKVDIPAQQLEFTLAKEEVDLTKTSEDTNGENPKKESQTDSQLAPASSAEQQDTNKQSNSSEKIKNELKQKLNLSGEKKDSGKADDKNGKNNTEK